eukprot:10337498-Alexandrium_andersonii.AAC.1
MDVPAPPPPVTPTPSDRSTQRVVKLSARGGGAEPSAAAAAQLELPKVRRVRYANERVKPKIADKHRIKDPSAWCSLDDDIEATEERIVNSFLPGEAGRMKRDFYRSKDFQT